LAKNLKLNVKNAQLAKVLNLGKAKAEAEKKKAAEAEAEEAKPEKKAPALETTPTPTKPEIPTPTKPEIPAPTPPAPKPPAPTTPPPSPTPTPAPTPPPAPKQPPTRAEQPQIGVIREPIRRPIPAPVTPAPAKEEKVEKKEVAGEKAAPAEKPAPEKKGGKFVSFKEFKDLKPHRKAALADSFDSRDRQGLRDVEQQERWRKQRRGMTKSRIVKEEPIIRPKFLKVRIPITIKDLAAEMKLKASELIAKLFLQGSVYTLNDVLDDETIIQLLGHEFDCEITIDTSEEERLRITGKTIKEEIETTPKEKLILRPPLITFMGHVDHGKTSLIDAIRNSSLAAGEAGQITQHIGAFKCSTAVGNLTILDTPGHEAFSAMRARGADITDIVVLVVAGDEGIRQQTLEAISQAREAKVPIVVAINKCDKPNYNVENIYKELSENELLPEAWGGNTITVNCSAVTGQGIKELLEMLALQAEILELYANPSERARGSVIESQLHKGLGSVATVLVQNGTLKLSDAIVFSEHWGRVKTMHDEHNRELREAGPSTPVKITGLSGLPEAGSEFIVVSSEKEAREVSEGRLAGRQLKALQTKRTGMESLLQKAEEKKKVLRLVLRADVQGSLEALEASLMKIKSAKVELDIISTEIGEISESDIELAAASKATIIGFHTKVQAHAEELIKQTKVPVKLHNIIYHAVDEVKGLMRALLDKIPEEKEMGEALVKAVFKSSHLGMIAGCQVTDGLIKRNHFVRLLRENKVVWKGKIASLKRVKEDVKEVAKGLECGILLQNYNDVKADDIIQAYEIIYHEQDL
jgi:translation initiation factor IF-2